MNIVIDFDNTLVQTNKAVLEVYRKETNDYSTNLSMLNSWWFDEICPKFTREQQNELFNNPRLFELLEPQENAIDILHKLKQEGHNLILCTIHHPNGIQYKAKYIHDNFDCFDSVVYIDLLKHKKLQKSIIKGDMLLDDSADYLKSSTVQYPICFGDEGWNSDWKNDRVLNWLEFYDKVHSITDYYKNFHELLNRRLQYAIENPYEDIQWDWSEHINENKLNKGDK
jgi:hypothetical protein